MASDRYDEVAREIVGIALMTGHTGAADEVAAILRRHDMPAPPADGNQTSRNAAIAQRIVDEANRKSAPPADVIDRSVIALDAGAKN